jgi:hypothetical protein
MSNDRVQDKIDDSLADHELRMHHTTAGLEDKVEELRFERDAAEARFRNLQTHSRPIAAVYPNIARAAAGITEEAPVSSSCECGKHTISVTLPTDTFVDDDVHIFQYSDDGAVLVAGKAMLISKQLVAQSRLIYIEDGCVVIPAANGTFYYKIVGEPVSQLVYETVFSHYRYQEEAERLGWAMRIGIKRKPNVSVGR